METITLTINPQCIAILLDYLQEDFEDWTDEEKRKDKKVLDAYYEVSKTYVACFGTNVKPKKF